MIIGPKYKICRRLGSGIFDKCQTQKFALSEGKKGRRGKIKGGRGGRALSDFGRQLLEKQKMRFTYGITEKQMTRYVKESVLKKVKNSTQNLFEILESRLDNVVYRSGIGITRQMARQMVSHGHIIVNGRKVTIPSFQISEGDIICVREGSRGSALFLDLSERLREYKTPNWLSFDVKKICSEIKAKPEYISEENLFDISLVLEFYSR